MSDDVRVTAEMRAELDAHYAAGTRLGHEAERLRRLHAAGDTLWEGALHNAVRARVEGLPLERHSPLVQMRSILDLLGVDHRAPDGFGKG